MAYQWLPDVRFSAHLSTQLQAMQNGLLRDMSGTLRSIHGEMAQIRKQTGEAMAIQQQLLAREVMQGYLEEFIYQAQKLVAECSRAGTDLSPSTRFFLLRSLIIHVGQEGIGTPIIKGRDNKAAFDGVMDSARSHLLALNQDTEVKQALAWAEEQKRREELEQMEEEGQRKRAEKKRRREDAERSEERSLESQKQTQTILLTIGGIIVAILASCMACGIVGNIINPKK